MCVFTDILLIALYSLVGLFFFPSSLILFSYDLMAIFNTVFGFLFFFVWIYIVDFWFVVSMSFWYADYCKLLVS